MNDHVIKGRGDNRGKYLCHSRMAGLPAGSFVWLPEQHKAARWDEERCKPDYYEGRIAFEQGGYFVRLTAKKSITARVQELERFIAACASGAKERPNCYWLDGDWNGDEGDDYCWECATKRVDEAFEKDPQQFAELYGYADDDETKPKAVDDYYHDAIRGGYSTDHGSMPYCQNDYCGALLDGNLTDDGATEEILALTSDGGIRLDDAEGWHCLYKSVMNLRNDDPRWNKIAPIVDAAMAEKRARVEREADLAASEGMVEARVDLLGLLAVRQEQKTSEPSFAMWTELLKWRRMPIKQRDENAEEIEEKMIPLAREFARDLGFYAYWSGGMFMIKAPYGTYYWPFVVLIEQHRLWKTPAFVEGQLCGPRCDRDSNPYPDGSYEHDAWDGGLMSTWVHE